jgi:hypothetical protein
MSSIMISSSRLKISFGAAPFSVESISNTFNGKKYLSDGSFRIIARSLQAVSDPAFLTELRSVSKRKNGVSFILSDSDNLYACELKIDQTEHGLHLSGKTIGPVYLWMVEFEIGPFSFDEIIVPALGGQSLSGTMPAGTTLSYKYPFWWNAQFAIGSAGPHGMLLRTMHTDPKFKMLRVRRTENGFNLVYGFECDGSNPSRSLEGDWYLDGYTDGWKRAVDVHKKWLEHVHGLVPAEKHPYFPDWMHKINFILELWGIGKEHHETLHTFDQMKKRLLDFSKLHSPENTMVYLSGWAEHGIDSRAPDYNPSKELGGSEKFVQLIEYAHKLGYRVMIHTNVLALTFGHSQFKKFERYQVIDVFGRKQGWGLDMDGDWLAEPYFAYINPGNKIWGDYMEKVIGEAISRYKIDAVFLDQTLLAFNVSKGPDFVIGMRKHIKRLQKAFPDILFGGEGINDYLLPELPYVQIHGIDSIANVHGMDERVPWRKAHPVSTYLMGKYTRFAAHLLTKHPSHPMFKLQEDAYERLGVLPALVLYNNKQKIDMPEVRRMIARAVESTKSA